MGNTSIEWATDVWNPVRGCSRVSEGCRHCYAERLAARNLPELRSPTTGKAFAQQTLSGPRWTGKVELIPSKLEEPLRTRRPRRYFVNSMSDLFHEALGVSEIAEVFGVMAAAQWHTFLVLTKRPLRMRGVMELESVRAACERRGGSLGPWPLPNVWLGVSVEDQAAADERIPLLLQTPAAVRFVSYEPALGPVDFEPYIFAPYRCRACGSMNVGYDPNPKGLPTVTSSVTELRAGELVIRPKPGTCLMGAPLTGEPGAERCNACGSLDVELLPTLDWTIVGGESGPGARPFDVGWASTTVAQCKAAGVPVFVKQLGALLVMDEAEWRAASPTRLLDYRKRRRAPEGTVPICLEDPKGGDMDEWPADLRVREFPAPLLPATFAVPSTGDHLIPGEQE